MSRRTERIAEDAARAASEAARTLAQRSHEARAERAEAPPQESPEKPSVTVDSTSTRFEKGLANRPSSLAMEEIIAKRERMEEAATPAPAEAPPPVPPPVPAPAPAPEAPPKVEEPIHVTAEAPAAPEPIKTVRVKVDGEEFDVPASDVEAAGGVSAYQQGRAAENRLRKQNESLAEVRKMQAQMAQMLEQAKPVAPQQTDQEFIEAQMNDLMFGTPEQKAKAWNAMTQRSIPRVDPNAIAMQASANMRYDIASQQFANEFQDIASNPMLMRLARDLEKEQVASFVVNGQPDWQKLSGVDWGLFKRTIGNQVRAAVGRPSQPAPTQGTTPSQPSSQSEKEARKASITTLPTAAAARAAPPQEEKELSPDEERKAWIAEQKKARGQG